MEVCDLYGWWASTVHTPYVSLYWTIVVPFYKNLQFKWDPLNLQQCNDFMYKVSIVGIVLLTTMLQVKS